MNADRWQARRRSAAVAGGVVAGGNRPQRRPSPRGRASGHRRISAKEAQNGQDPILSSSPKGKEKANQLLQRAGRWNALDLALKPAPKVETLPLAGHPGGDVQGPVEPAKTFANGPSPANDPRPLAGQIGSRDRSWPRIRTSVGLRRFPPVILVPGPCSTWSRGPSGLDRRPCGPDREEGVRSDRAQLPLRLGGLFKEVHLEGAGSAAIRRAYQLAGERAMGTSSLRLHRPMDKRKAGEGRSGP